ncbi:ABC transporter permease [Aureimonas endophytica]|uniref:ABC transporter permease n=1 Tax=Aureimonas endophytica TaxID=2027858 RepID=A0A916ZBL3_9HYPH|nr:ABC transporter permease [Aureimonas endophytica]GGD86737.1 ABC transporter permease [Aureimonas endophytica]
MPDSLTLLGFGPTGWGLPILGGVVVTITLALATLPLGLAAGFFIALGKQSRDPALRLSSDVYTTIFRGLPELLTLFLIYFGAQRVLNLVTDALGFANQEISPFVSGMLALGLVFSAFASEVFLSAFRAIPQGQREGAMALGLSRFNAMRLVILPQVLRYALPGLANLYMNLLKDTSLVSVVGLADTMRQTGVAARVTREPFLFFGAAIVIYLVLTILSSFVIGAIEIWTKRGEAAR